MYAVRDFHPKNMSHKEKTELGYFLQSRKLTNRKEEIVLPFKRGDVMETIPPANFG